MAAHQLSRMAAPRPAASPVAALCPRSTPLLIPPKSFTNAIRSSSSSSSSMLSSSLWYCVLGRKVGIFAPPGSRRLMVVSMSSSSSSGGPVQKSEEEWKAILSPEQFRILRLKGTEFPGVAVSAWSAWRQLFDVRTWRSSSLPTVYLRVRGVSVQMADLLASPGRSFDSGT